jgi:hypothetical protein
LGKKLKLWDLRHWSTLYCLLSLHFTSETLSTWFKMKCYLNISMMSKFLKIYLLYQIYSFVHFTYVDLQLFLGIIYLYFSPLVNFSFDQNVHTVIKKRNLYFYCYIIKFRVLRQSGKRKMDWGVACVYFCGHGWPWLLNAKVCQFTQWL